MMAFRIVVGSQAMGGGVATLNAINAPHDPTKKLAQPTKIDGIYLG
jgi:hypothetical protein